MQLIIYGAGGLGREIYDTLLSINSITSTYQIKGFVDDFRAKGSLINGLPVLGSACTLEDMRGQVAIVLGVADPSARKNLHTKYKDHFSFPSIIHATAIVSNFAHIGEAVLIQSNCVVAANAHISDGVMMNAHSGVGHDAQIGKYCSIMSYCDLAGNTELESLCFVGTGVKVIPHTKIAAESYLCAGSVVFKDVKEKSKLLGNPARVIG